MMRKSFQHCGSRNHSLSAGSIPADSRQPMADSRDPFPESLKKLISAFGSRPTACGRTVAFQFVPHHSWCVGFVLLLLVGCSSSNEETPMLAASAAKRAERRLFPGAPPVIPHPPLSGKCVTCHTPTGSSRPPLGLAPANPHTKTAGMSDESRCKQCHVFQTTQDEFVASTFESLRLDGVHGTKAHSLAPPTIPHQWFMREDCSSCHTGPASRPEIRCAHADRARCVQCHVFQTPGDSPFENPTAEPTQAVDLNRLKLDFTGVHANSTP